MATTTYRGAELATERPRRDWRGIVFSVVSALIGLFLLKAVGPLLLAPWTLVGPAIPDYTPELHRWHHADISALIGLLICGSLLAALPRPRRSPLLTQFVLLASGILALACVYPFRPTTLIPAVAVIALVVAAYPDRRALLSFPREGSSSRPLLALAAASAVPLLLNAWANLRLQYTDVSQHARDNHWNGSVALALALIVAGLLTATRRPGWRALGVITGGTYLYLGATALSIPAHDGSWGLTGGVLALLGGAGYLALTALEARRGRSAAQPAPYAAASSGP